MNLDNACRYLGCWGTGSGDMRATKEVPRMVDNFIQVTEPVEELEPSPCTPCPVTAPNDICQVLDGKCAGRSRIPPAVTIIVGTQCILFGLFGVVLTFLFATAGCVHDIGKTEGAWYSVSMVYAVLSVTAKTTLEISFLVMLAQISESTNGA